MPAPEKSPAPLVSLEDLLRLKRSERPAAEFWPEWEKELRQKQLAALLTPIPWTTRAREWLQGRAGPVWKAATGLAGLATVAFFSWVSIAPTQLSEAPVPAAPLAMAAESEAPVAERSPLVVEGFSAPVEFAPAPSVSQPVSEPAFVAASAPEEAASAPAVTPSSVESSSEPTLVAPWGTTALAGNSAAESPSSLIDTAGQFVSLSFPDSMLTGPAAQVVQTLNEHVSAEEAWHGGMDEAPLMAVTPSALLLASHHVRTKVSSPARPARRVNLDEEEPAGWSRLGVTGHTLSIKF